MPLLPVQSLLFLANVCLVTVAITSLGWLAVFLLAGRPAPLRHAVGLMSLWVALASPALLGFASRLECGAIEIALPHSGPRADVVVRSRTIVPRISLKERAPFAERLSSRRASTASDPRERATKEDHAAANPVQAGVSAPADRPSTETSWWQILGTVFAGVWGAGVLLGLSVLARGGLVLRRFRASCVPCERPAVARAADRAARSVGLVRTPQVWESPVAVAPLVIGVVRPRVVLPTRLPQELDPERLEAVLLHEMGHVVRRDPWFASLGRVLGVLLWWNVCLHALNRTLAALREEICDNHVLRVQGTGFHYAHVLIDLAERVRDQRRRPAHPISIGLLGSTGHPLETRIRNLVQEGRSIMTKMNMGSAVFTTGFALAAVGATLFCAARPVLASSPQDPDEGKQRAKAKVEELLRSVKSKRTDHSFTTELTLQTKRARMGAPLIVKVEIKNTTKESLAFDRQSLARPAYCFAVHGPDGKPLPVIHRPQFQTMQSLQRIEPGAAQYLTQIDLRRYFLFAAAGPHAVKFRGWGGPALLGGARNSFMSLRDGTVIETSRVRGVPGAGLLKFKVATGRRSSREELLSALHGVLPASWSIISAREGVVRRLEGIEAPVRGCEVELQRRRGLKSEALVGLSIFATEDGLATSRADQEGLGSSYQKLATGSVGAVFVKRKATTEAIPDWPRVVEDLRAAVAVLGEARTPREPEKLAKLRVVRTWAELRAQKAFDLEGGLRVRLGMEADRARVHEGVLLYCLVEGRGPINARLEALDVLGPISCSTRKVGSRHDPGVAKVVRVGNDPSSGASERLYQRSIGIPEAGSYLVHLRTRDAGRPLAWGEIRGLAEEAHAWCCFANAKADARERVAGGGGATVTRVATRSDGWGLPHQSGIEPVSWSPGEERPAGDELLPALIPPLADLELAAEVRAPDLVRLTLTSERAMIINDPFGRLLVRYWVNQRPFQPEFLKSIEAEDPGFLVQGRKAIIDLELTPEHLGARVGDRIEIQLLYLPGGWLVLGFAEVLMRPLLEDEMRISGLTNRVGFTLK